MRKLTIRTAAKPASKPVAKRATAKPVVAAKPGKPATVAPTSAKPEAKPATGGRISHTAKTIAAQATNFGGTLSDRDNAYIAFYASFAKRTPAGTVSIADVFASGKRPAYNGSNKPHDAGVVVRLTKAGIVAQLDNGNAFRFTEAGKKLGVYSSAKPA